MASKKHKATNRTISTPTTTKQAFFFPSKSSVQVNLALPKIPIHLIKSEANSYKASSILNPMHTHTYIETYIIHGYGHTYEEKKRKKNLAEIVEFEKTSGSVAMESDLLGVGLGHRQGLRVKP
jgi:hypothetical protein